MVDNGSTTENREIIEKYLNEQNIRYLYGKYSFNFSKMCNFGAEAANGEYLLFLNDDIEIISGVWLERMLGQAQQSHTGAVGAKLIYPVSTIIQHAGVTNLYEGPDHNFLRLDDRNPYYFAFNWVDYDCSAVTAACLLVKKAVFEEVGRFNESLPIAYNDVDLCWKIYEAGYYNVVRNDAIAVHHESLSRGFDLSDHGKLLRLRRERMNLMQRHPFFQDGDPFLNPNLHMYTAILDLKTQRDKLEVFKMPEAEETGFAVLDVVWRVDDSLMIQGWSCISELQNNDGLMRWLILEDPYGNCFRSDLEYVYRPDVAEAMKRKDLLNSGFACYIDPEIIRTDIMSYRLSVLSKDTSGKTYLTKISKSTGVTASQNTDQFTNYNRCVSIEPYQAPERVDVDNMFFILEQCEEQEEALVLRGWGYCEGNRHYLYKPYIILRDEGGNAMQFEAERQMRSDVANELPYVHFLLNAGFRCVINPEQVPFGHTYDVLIRMVNQLDLSDIREWKFDRQLNRFENIKLEKKIRELQQNQDGSEIELTNILLLMNSQKNETISLLLDQLNEKNDKIEQLAQKVKTQEHLIESLSLEKNVQVQRAVKAEEAYQTISNSSFWRMTSPARKILDVIKDQI